MNRNFQQFVHAMRPDRTSTRNGFTLIELLVVISIIAVMVGLLLPAIGMARSSANSLICQNNQRQMMIAAVVYADDNEDRLPGIGYGKNYYHWTSSLAPYLEKYYVWDDASNDSFSIYRCPANDPIKLGNSSSWPTHYASGYALSQFSSVRPNASGKAGYWRDSRMPAEIRTSWIKRASEWMLWGEVRLTYGWWHCLGSTSNDVAFGTSFPHRGHMTMSFADGHVGSQARQDYDAWNNWKIAE
ncbi:MAG: type II secretion system protein [Planctomycetota bacterium]|jgi:prepilin-type N-terminal cleavage/methylation domain-containing protein/prepilin-type processing-associated H-X9-DG protein|nr:type II secretion system protein [Planctomycetota bacterium]